MTIVDLNSYNPVGMARHTLSFTNYKLFTIQRLRMERQHTINQTLDLMIRAIVRIGLSVVLAYSLQKMVAAKKKLHRANNNRET